MEKRTNKCVCVFFSSFSLRYFLKGAVPCRWLQQALASTPTHTCTHTHTQTHEHTAVAARDIPAAAALSLPRTRPPSDLPGGRMPNESRACLPLPRSMCVCVCVCVEAGWRADLARALGERGRGNEETTERERGKKNERERRVGGGGVEAVITVLT